MKEKVYLVSPRNGGVYAYRLVERYDSHVVIDIMDYETIIANGEESDMYSFDQSDHEDDYEEGYVHTENVDIEYCHFSVIDALRASLVFTDEKLRKIGKEQHNQEIILYNTLAMIRGCE